MLEQTRVAIYARVSTNDQNVDNQVRQLNDWASERNWQVVNTYQENESAWKSGHQSELASALKAARHRQFDVLLVWALDRLSREGSAQILNLVNTLRAYGVRVFSLQESWTEAPGEIGDILYAIAGWVARMESQRRSERTKAGLSRLKAQGKVLGRPPGSKDKHQRKKVRKISRLNTYA
jgi:DNA invertase Pin-like site-specific DNA recombinase